MLYIDNSILSSIIRCETLAVMNYVFHLDIKGDSAPLKIGDVGHEVLADYFKGKSIEDCLSLFKKLYLEYSDLNNLDIGFTYPEVKFVIQTYMEENPIENFPFETMTDYVETGIEAELCDGIMYYAKIDMPVKDRLLGLLAPMDHKFRTGQFNSYWASKFDITSQLTSYIWAMRKNFEKVGNTAWVNGIHVPKGGYPQSNRKCKQHGVLHKECKRDHVKWQIFPTTRNEENINAWYQGAVYYARRFQELKEKFTNVYQIPGLMKQGEFDDGCVSPFKCNLIDWCKRGRRLEDIDRDFVIKKWSPWRESV